MQFFYLHKLRIQLEVRKADFIAVFQVYITHPNWLCSVTVAEQIYLFFFFSPLKYGNPITEFHNFFHLGTDLLVKERKTRACNNPLIKWENDSVDQKHQNKKDILGFMGVDNSLL